MSVESRKYLIVIVILVIASIFILKIEQTKGKITTEIDLSGVPLNLDNWEGREVKLPDSVYEILGTRDVLSRQYKDKEGDIVELSIVYSGHDRQSFHPPELCYIGGGVDLTGKSTESISLDDGSTLDLNKLTMQSSQGTIKAWYWFLVGDRFVGNFYKQQVYFILDALSGKKLQGALIRVSIRGDSEVLERKAKSFIGKIAPHLAETF